MTEDVTYHSSFVLYFAILPILIFLFELKTLKAIKLPISSKSVFSAAKKSLKNRLEFLPPFLKMLALLLLIIAIARPQIAIPHKESLTEGIDIVLALDTSRSMLALDMQEGGQRADRMSVVKSVVKDFIKGRANDRIGMVVFGQQAYTQCPLTLDYDIVTGYLDLIDVGIAGDATAIGNALATAVKRLQGSKAKSRIVILLTDGANTAGEVSPKVAAELASEEGIKVYTIAVGSKNELVPFPVEGFFGTQIRNVKLEIDEELLKEIAAKTGGQFFRADTTDMLKVVYSRIDELEKTKSLFKEFTEYDERYWPFLAASLMLLILGWLLRQTIFLRVP
jgi:Ca-activated chloride channel family protein